MRRDVLGTPSFLVTAAKCPREAVGGSNLSSLNVPLGKNQPTSRNPPRCCRMWRAPARPPAFMACSCPTTASAKVGFRLLSSLFGRLRHCRLCAAEAW